MAKAKRECNVLKKTHKSSCPQNDFAVSYWGNVYKTSWELKSKYMNLCYTAQLEKIVYIKKWAQNQDKFLQSWSDHSNGCDNIQKTFYSLNFGSMEFTFYSY